MKVKNYLEVKATQELPGVLKREVITAQDGAPSFCMRVFEVEPGGVTPNHTHPWEHEVFVLAGEGAAVGEGGETPIAEGSAVFIAPDEPHCLVNKSDQPLRFICLIPLPK